MNNYLVGKLFVSVLAITDTGSVSTNTMSTDLPFGQCTAIARELTQNSETNMAGHQVAVRVKAYCEPLQGVAGGIPPPVAGMIRGFLGGF